MVWWMRVAVVVGGVTFVAGCGGGRDGTERPVGTRAATTAKAGRVAATALSEVETVRYDVWDMLSSSDPEGGALKVPEAGAEEGLWREEAVMGAREKEVMEEIMDTVEAIVAADTWKEKGGKVGVMAMEPKGVLVVTQTRENQKGGAG